MKKTLGYGCLGVLCLGTLGNAQTMEPKGCLNFLRAHGQLVDPWGAVIGDAASTPSSFYLFGRAFPTTSPLGTTTNWSASGKLARWNKDSVTWTTLGSENAVAAPDFLAIGFAEQVGTDDIVWGVATDYFNYDYATLYRVVVPSTVPQMGTPTWSTIQLVPPDPTKFITLKDIVRWGSQIAILLEKSTPPLFSETIIFFYDGSNLSSFALPTFNNKATTLHVHNGSLFVGGRFNTLNGHFNVGVVSGGPNYTFSESGEFFCPGSFEEFPGLVFDLETHNGSLYASGSFGVPGINIARREESTGQWISATSSTTTPNLPLGTVVRLSTLGSNLFAMNSGFSIDGICDTNACVGEPNCSNIFVLSGPDEWTLPDAACFTGGFVIESYLDFNGQPFVVEHRGELVVQATTGGICTGLDSYLRYANRDPLDFNQDGSVFDPIDLDDYMTVFSEGDCPPPHDCLCVDYNCNGSLEPDDYQILQALFAETITAQCSFP